MVLSHGVTAQSYQPSAQDTAKTARFWSRADRSRGPASCWLWTRYRSDKGYGLYSGQRAHRVAWTLANGAIPAGLKVLHNCPDGDTPACVNPAHLFLGTPVDNSRDMVAKGRSRFGARNPNAKLDAGRVRAIRTLHGTGELSYSDLAFLFDVSRGLVGRIVEGKRWNAAALGGVA